MYGPNRAHSLKFLFHHVFAVLCKVHKLILYKGSKKELGCIFLEISGVKHDDFFPMEKLLILRQKRHEIHHFKRGSCLD